MPNFEIDALLQECLCHSHCDWTKLDPTSAFLRFKRLSTVNCHWLHTDLVQISPNPCGGGVSNYHSAPSDINRWRNSQLR